MTPSEVAKLVAILLAAYPAGQYTEATARVYERELADLDASTASTAVQRLVRTAKWLPTIAEIRAAASDVQRGPKRLGAEAWGDVTEAVHRVGHYKPAPEFTDALVGECVRMLGWRNLCLGANDVSDRARFIELYDGLTDRQRVDQCAGRALPSPAPTGALPWRVPELRRLPAPKPPKPLTEAQRDALAAVDGADRKGAS